MLIIKETFTAKPGQATNLAKLFKKGFAKSDKVRIMTDFIGNYNTVIMEMQVESLSEFEKEMEKYKSGEGMDAMDSKMMKDMENYHEMFLVGKREVFQVLE